MPHGGGAKISSRRERRERLLQSERERLLGGRVVQSREGAIRYRKKKYNNNKTILKIVEENKN